MDFNFNLKDKKFWLKVIAAILLIPFVLNMTLFQFTTRFTYQGGDWLSFWGSYLGGFSSGIIALIVALATIREDRKKYSYDLVIKQLPVMVRIKMELEKIINNIDRATRVKKDNEELPLFSEDYEFLYMADVELIDKEKWDSLDKIQDIDLQVKLLELRQFYETFSDSLRYDMVANKNNLDWKKRDLNLKRKQAVTIMSPVEEHSLMAEIAELGREIDYYRQIREQCFKELEEGYSDKIEQLLKELLSAMNEIKQEKKNFEEG
ncbi:hypothetical protein MOC55_13630 [Bacillus spizizenii]|uniref:Uncharacterized protein n=1 Tax=Bacillus spizizenii TaxID=96241 RepID=A0A9Q4HBK6_BACSC|nr:hypothetical protein [Bacillus spizizenii]MCY8155504.1 hypothetical protein [Bacillus spizizenii]MCY8312902.1 hypothetical protein [Bacillus spizizenii]MCY8416683.1 hypothetical protein [Bacillus spizizenii]MCY9333757.1 hypothetical protein [Bacillus spizizenii]